MASLLIVPIPRRATGFPETMRKNGYTVRNATPDDVGRCVELLRLLFSQEAEFEPDPALQRKGLCAIIDDPSKGCVLVCEKTAGGRIDGMAVLLATVSTALGRKVLLLEDMIVEPSRRSAGIGSLLLEHSADLARKEGFGRITLLTDGDNRDAHRFYEKNGFERSGMVVFRKAIPSRD